MKPLAAAAMVLLASCSAPSASTPSPSPSTRATASIVSVACPARGTARAATLAPITLGSHPTILYVDEPPANGTAPSDTLIRYDLTTASKTEILHTPINAAQVSPDGQWIALTTPVSSQPGLQLIRTDGQYRQTVFCGDTNGSIRGMLWSQDGKSLFFSVDSASGPPPIYRVDLSKGTMATVLQNNRLSVDYVPLAWLDATHMLVRGLPVGLGPGYELRILDVSQSAPQQAADLPLVLNSSVQCFDADSGESTVYSSECTGAFSDQGGATLLGPSTIRAQSPSGGQKRTVLDTPALAVTQIRALGSTGLLLSVANQDPAQSSASSMNGLWKVNPDGSGLTRLLASSGTQGQFGIYGQVPWTNVSRDGSLFAFQLSNTGKPPSYSLVVGPIAGGKSTAIASRADGGSLLVIGWTTS